MTDETKTIEPGADASEENITLDVAENAASEDAEAPMMERRDTTASNGLKRAIFNVPIEVVVSVGTARPLIGELLTMGRNHLLPLDNKIDDPVELRVKDRVIARGELTQMPEGEGQLGIRLTEVVSLSDLTE